MDRRLAERIERIAEDRSHGGSWLAREAVEALCEAIRRDEDALEVARALADARPSMGAVAGALGRVLAAGRTPDQLVEEAEAVIALRERAARAIAVQLREELAGTVMTHSASATVREALLYARPPAVVCTASEPRGEGRAFARELDEAGLEVELVEDEAAGARVAGVDRLLLGADTVFRDGVLMNKIGTAALAAAAQRAGVETIVACEVLKVCPTGAPSALPAAEAELRDLTPAAAIAGFVTEEGRFAPAEVASLVDQTPFLRDGYALLRG